MKKRYSDKIAQRRKAKRNFSLFLKMILPAIFLVGLVWLLRASFLQVKDFQFAGNDTLRAEDLKSFAQNQVAGRKLIFIPKTNILFLNKDELASALLSNFNRLERVSIDKKIFSRSVNLDLAERKAAFIWCADSGECFNMTSGGLVFEPTFETDKIVFRGGISGEPLLKNFASPEVMENYLKLIAEFEKAGFKISSIKFETGDRVIAKLSIKDATSDIIFNPHDPDFSLLIQNTILLIGETLTKNPKAVFDYIDARFGNKFFYKLK